MSTVATAYGLVIAVVGFLLTRFTVTLAAADSTVTFLFAGIVPLLLGLSLTAFGVILAVGAYDVRFVRTTAVWCVLGTLAMFLLIVLTLLGSQPETLMNVDAARDQTYLSNFLIGGATGGTLTGLYAAQNDRQRRDLRQQANRLILLNRLLRDEVINAATAIKGHSQIIEAGEDGADPGVIDQQADAVIDTVENVKYLAETADRDDSSLGSVEVCEILTEEVGRARARHPDASISLTGVDETVRARASAQLGEVFRHLIENAVEYSDSPAPAVEIDVSATSRVASVRITDDGPGLPESQQQLLEQGEIAEFDDPSTGFGLNIVRLLVESFDGMIETTVTEGGSTVEVTLPRTRGVTPASGRGAVTAPGVAPSRIGLAFGASLLAGGVMGAGMVALGGDVPVIGALYGVENRIVALITHQFHSVVFGLTFAGLLSVLPVRLTRSSAQKVGLGVGFGLFLWLVAAGIIMPVWLRLVGIAAPLPNLTGPSLAGHLLWGSSLAILYHGGDLWLDRADLPQRLFELPSFART